LSPECHKKRIYSDRAGHIFSSEGRIAMKNVFSRCRRGFVGMGILLLVWGGNTLCVHANPTGGAVAQGTATFNTSGSQFTINQTSASAFINWQSFNIGLGETTTFVQPSSTSVVWNHINDPNPSQILGALNANGYVILQNSSGFYVGGQAAISTHGLIMTTASTPALDLSSAGPWSFNLPPPTAKIVNYGQIKIVGGGSAFLIANDIENNGTISAPGGKIGLYAGQKVLVSTSPDGRGLSAQVTIPQGIVDNEGNLIADAGSIALHAQVVNQDGLVQANSARNVNGTIELVAGDAVNLGANSVISAHGDTQGTSPGGSVIIKSDDSFSDQAGSTINISGGSQGGNGGSVEISAPSMAALHTQINGQAQPGSVGGTLFLDPDYIVLNQSGSGSINVNGSSGTSLVGDNPGSTLYLDVGTSDYGYSDSAFIGLSQITLQAKYDITLAADTAWNLSGSTGQSSGQLKLEAGGNIIFGDGAQLFDANNWSVSLQAGYDFVNNAVQNGIGSIYIGDFDGSTPLDNSGSIQTAAGSISLTAGQDILVGSGYVNTIGGGSISVKALSGDVNTGTSLNGFNFFSSAPYYTPFSLKGPKGGTQTINYGKSSLGGIGTAGGGDVAITAGGDVISYLPTGSDSTSAGNSYDAGAGAFGSQPGNVTISAGGSVYGHYVVVNGTGTITVGGDIGDVSQNVALSLVKGSWNLNAQGNIYLQEVRNPNGVFGGTTRGGSGPGDHLFNYDPSASVSLTAGNGVYLTGQNLPRPNGAVPLLMPPTLIIHAGSGGIVLQTPTAVDSSGGKIRAYPGAITLFPSPDGDLQIYTTDGGWLMGGNANGTTPELLMSDSAQTQWFIVSSGPQPFSDTDHGSIPTELNNYNPVIINLTGSINSINNVPVLASMEDIILQTDKATQINVAGDMIGCSFYGENLHASDVTSITVGGQIYNAGSFNSVTLNGGVPDLLQLSQDLPSGLTYLPLGTVNAWSTVLVLAVDPNSPYLQISTTTSLLDYNSYVNNARLTSSLDFNPSANFAYNPTTKTLTYIGPMSVTTEAALDKSELTLVLYRPDGTPDVTGPYLNPSTGKYYYQVVTATIPWVPTDSTTSDNKIDDLYTASQGAPALGNVSGAYIVGGTGEFDVNAASISLGNSLGILSVGNGSIHGLNYSSLIPYITSGATINVTADTLELPSSTIAALGGGDVNVTCTGEIPNSAGANGVGVSMDLGSQDLVQFDAQIMSASLVGLGIYTSGGGNVKVTAYGTINVDSSRIATFNGGNVNVTSQTGDVNAGSGGAIAIPVNVFSPYYSIPYNPFESVFANGIVADTLDQLPNGSQVPGPASLPGNITVTTPQGNIKASLGGILQEVLGGILSAGPTVTLTAGTPAGNDWNSSDPPLYVGDVELGQSGVIGGTVNVKATGKVSGLLISQQNANVQAVQSFSGTILSGGTANLSAGGTVSGTIIGATGVNATGGGGVSASLLGQNVSVNGGAAQSTLGTSATATSTSQSAAGQASSDTQQQVASNDTNDDEKKNKKKSALVRSVGRVTVILPKAS
jgi:filamentous hemagglutinin family protein